MHGLDTATPPKADDAKALLDRIGGSWWNVYIGGPRASVTWQPEQVQAYRAKGIKHFLLTYVGRQERDVPLLTTAQGGRDGESAVRIAETFGFGSGSPVALDLENRTFNAAPRASLDYVEGWCAAVRGMGLRPGVYTNVAPLNELAKRAIKPDWVWVARWVRDAFDPNIDHRRIPGLADDLWAGSRVWQYVGEVMLGGTQVDIDVTDAASGGLIGTTPGSSGAGFDALSHFQLDAATFDAFLATYRS